MMIRSALIFFVLLYTLLTNVHAQAVQAEPVMDKFKHFYQMNKADSIYTLFDPKMQQAIQPAGTLQLINQLQQMLGGIKQADFVQLDQNQIAQYLLVFDKPIVNMAVYIKDGKIIGIQQKPIQQVKDEQTEKESPDNFTLKTATASISGTLLLPNQTGKVPLVLIIAGSGPTDRNMNQGTTLKTNAFLMLAKYLAENGIASLRYDKRGVGKSKTSKPLADVVFEDFVSDAKELVKTLKADARFSKIILLGHSEGALIATLVAQGNGADALISVSGNADDFGTILRKQLKAILNPDDDKLANAALDSLGTGKRVNGPFPAQLAPIFDPTVQSFLISVMKYNSAKEIAKVKLPTLVIGGSTDIQVDATNATKLAKANPKAQLKIITGMNHVLKHAPADREGNLATYNAATLPLVEDLKLGLLDFIKTIK